MSDDSVRQTLLEAKQQQCNRRCADCGKEKPEWASTNLGVFLCLNCAGVHRSFGTGVSKVKSLNLDKWSMDLAKNMLKIGNQKANIYWEKNLPHDYLRPTWESQTDMGDFIRMKYIEKRWTEKNPCSKSLTETVKDELPTFDLLSLS